MTANKENYHEYIILYFDNSNISELNSPRNWFAIDRLD